MLQVSPFMYQGAPWSPLKCITLVMASRPRHLVRSPANGPPTSGASPTHGGYATLLPSVRFRSLAEDAANQSPEAMGMAEGLAQRQEGQAERIQAAALRAAPAR
jgi:hypothetical protein